MTLDIFISYSHIDEGWLELLRKQLKSLEREGLARFWYDRLISAGKPVDAEISSALKSAQIILLLVSADFVASEYCWEKEMRIAMEQSKAGKARVIPIILRPVVWQHSTFGGLKALPKDGKPISIWPNSDEALVTVAIAIREVIADLSPDLSVKRSGTPEPAGADEAEPETGMISRATSADHDVARFHRDVLWRLAYAFLRLDQLTSGGWARSLPGWLEALLDGPDDIIITAETRTKGGTDLTSRAFLTYVRFLRRLNYDKPSPGEPLSKREIAGAVRQNISDKIGWDGGVGVGKPGRAAHHIRHTLMGLLTLLYVSECTGTFPEKDISRVEKYLTANLANWRIDRSHPFACFCILAKIREKLAEMDFVDQWNFELLISEINKVLPEMSAALCTWEKFDLVPHATCRVGPNAFHFQPYQGFWRMERSNFLMYLPLLVTEDGKKFNFQNTHLCDLLALELKSIVRDIGPLPDEMHGKYVHYHLDAAVDGRRPLDFGLTAELFSVLTMPAIRDLVTFSDQQLGSLHDDLDAALIRGLGRYHDWPIFKFTHSVSLGQYLEVVAKEFINVEAIRILDKRIDRTIKGAVTEYELDWLCKSIVQDVFGDQPGEHEPLASNMRDMLVEKLASGEHIPKDGDAPPVLQHAPTFGDWRDRVGKALGDTIRFFDGPGGEEYAQRYESRPIEDYVSGICRLVELGGSRGNVLDVGCGPGQYAELLKKKGYKVDLADASIQMLRRAHKRLHKRVPSSSDLKRIENLASDFKKPEAYDIVFACAMMIHVPHYSAAEVYREFHRLIRPGGALFVNFKIGDNTLIGIGERYHEYYRDYRVPWRMLEEAGFVVREISMTFNRETMYRDPRCIHWANFFCGRPGVASPSSFDDPVEPELRLG